MQGAAYKMCTVISRMTWRIINELTSRKIHSSSVKEIKWDNSSISDPLELSSVFNDHFSSIGPKLINAIQQNGDTASCLDYVKETDHRFELKTTDCSKVFFLLSKLCKPKATELDKISARPFRECADLVTNSLCAIFNRPIVSGIFPPKWKSTKVIPSLKQEERSDLNNYRPISIIPVVAKVFERIVYNQFYEYLTENNLISCISQGFVPFTPLLPPYSKPQIIGLLISIKVMLMQWFFLIWRKLLTSFQSLHIAI